MRKGQSTFDYLILTGVILAVIVPLLFFSTGRIDTNRLSELQDALEALKDGVTQVGNLGFGTSTVVVVRVPKGVVEQIVGVQSRGGSSKGKQGYLYYKIAGNDLHVRVPADVDGVLPTNEGLHYVQLFNNGTAVLLYECGNNKREAFEQCDGTDRSACDYVVDNGPIKSIARGTCLPPTVSQGACRCSCRSNDQCEGTTRYCDPRGFCGPCSSDSQCGSGKVCLYGRCTEKRPCTKNEDCPYPREVCNKASNMCEPCDPDDRSKKQCDAGYECKRVAPNPPRCEPILGCRSNADCSSGSQVCDRTTGRCGPCDDRTNKCAPPKVCDLRNGRCVDPPRICNAGNPCPGGYYCDTNTGACRQQPRCDSSNCPLPNQCRNNVCTPQSCSGQFCPGNYVCDRGICKRCTPTLRCPGAYTCNTNIGMCAPNDPVRQRGPQCGNNVLEPGEMCEKTSDCPALQGFTARCSDCVCFYERVERRRPDSVCPNGIIEPPDEECEKASDCRVRPRSVALCIKCKCDYVNEGEIEW